MSRRLRWEWRQDTQLGALTDGQIYTDQSDQRDMAEGSVRDPAADRDHEEDLREREKRDAGGVLRGLGRRLDSDMVFAPDILERLFADYSAGKGDIISGLYFRRVAPFKPVLFSAVESTAEGPFTAEPESIPDDVFEIAGCGFGCVLMPTGVLMDVIGKYGNPFDPINGMGEDLSFCWRARQCGYKIVCDPAISLGHVANMVVDRSFFDSYNSHKEGNE